MVSNRSIGFGMIATGLAIGALVPIFLIAYPAAGLSPSAAADAGAFLRVVPTTPALFVWPGLLQLAGHAIGGFAILALWWRLGRQSFLLSAATVAGITWIAVDVVDNAMGLQVVPALASRNAAGDASAAGTFATFRLLTDALRLAGHFAGGLWMLGISAGLLRAKELNVAIAAVGLAVGAAFAANPILPPLLNVSFMTVPAWLVVFGIALARRVERPVLSAVGAGAVAAAAS